MADKKEEAKPNKSWGLIIEQAYPIFVGGIAGAVYFNWFRNSPLPQSLNELLSAVINVSAITVGFLATVKSIMFSIQHTKTIRQLKETGDYDRFVAYLIHAIRTSFIVAVITSIMLLFSWKDASGKTDHVPDLLQSILFGVWLVLVIIATASCFRVLRIFGKLLYTRHREKAEGE